MREFKVGLLVIAALVALAAGIFFVGESNNLFSLKSHYYVQFETVSGLAVGNPVQLNGVTVGRVEGIDLPEDVDERLLRVNVSIDRRYADRVRSDSEARIKTLGLLGDKYIQITSGSPEMVAIASGGEIKAAEATDVDQLISSGENAVDNFVAISVSLREILARMESGEGILGQLTADSETGSEARDKVFSILSSIDNIAKRIDRGEGTLGRLITDDTLALRIESSVGRIESNLTLIEEGEGALPALLRDGETKESLFRAIESLNTAASELTSLTKDIREGEGLLPRLLNDPEYGDRISRDLENLLRNLSEVSERLESGEGTAGQLLNDPQIHDALRDVMVGVNESRMLRWLIRNRQKKGIEKRYDAELEEAPQLPEVHQQP